MYLSIYLFIYPMKENEPNIYIPHLIKWVEETARAYEWSKQEELNMSVKHMRILFGAFLLVYVHVTFQLGKARL